MSDLGSRSTKRVKALIEDVLGDHGRVARRRRHHRPQQSHIDVACAVADALATPCHLIIHSSGGTDTVLPYLVPAVLANNRRTSRIVISAATAARREQLLERDIPLLQAIMPQEFTAVEVKPRHHYLGLRRMNEALHKKSLLFEQRSHRRALRRIARWATQTTTGALADVPASTDLALWDRINSEHGNCMGHRCASYRACFFQRARKRSEHAHILVVDHELLLADLTVRKRGGMLIPEYDYAIIDEAEHLPAIARQRLGVALSSDHIDHLLDALYAPSGCGFLASCHAQSAVGAVIAARRANAALFDELARWHQTMQEEVYTCPIPVNNGLSPALRHLGEQLARVRSLLVDENDLFEMTSFMERSTALADVVEELLQLERDNSRYRLGTMKTAEGTTRVTLRATPVDDATDLADGLFNSIGSVVLAARRLPEAEDDHTLAEYRGAVGLADTRILRVR